MTTTTTLEIEQYYERVRAALAGLAPQAREDLLEDLPDHLAEVSADGEGTLADRLGEPEAYAEELRTAAGLDAAPVGTRAGGLQAGLVAAVRRGSELADRFDVGAARLVGYPRLTDLLRAVRPGWWVLRGWIVAQFLCGAHDRASWHGFVPSTGGNTVLGLLLMVMAVLASVWLGRQSVRMRSWGRRLMALASVVIAIWAVTVLAHNVGGTAYAYNDPGFSYSSPYDSINDIYVYERDGKLVDGARLFDQNGNPLQLGAGACADGSSAFRVVDGINWTYPLCPSDTGPFRAGPGPAPSGSSPSGGSPSGSSPSGSSASTRPTPTPTR
ncbi:MAG: hypothetical protein ACR2N4_08500 [Jatrophihabitans sp.]